MLLHSDRAARGQLAPGSRVSVSVLLRSDLACGCGQLAPRRRVSASMLLPGDLARGQLAWSGSLPPHCSRFHWLRAQENGRGDVGHEPT
eukprot:g17094.t1